MSVDQIVPEIRLATARCQIARWPVWASRASVTDVTSRMSVVSSRTMRPCRISAAAPTKAPSSAIGRTRSIVMTVTRSAEPVCW